MLPSRNQDQVCKGCRVSGRPNLLSGWLGPIALPLWTGRLARALFRTPEAVLARTHLEHGPPRFRAEELHALRPDCRLAALADASFGFCRHIDRRGGIDRHGDIPTKHVTLFLPLAGDRPVRRVVRRLHELQVPYWLRPHDDVLETRLRGVGLDAREVFVEPDAQISHQHDVVA